MSGHGTYGAFCHGEFTVTESPSYVCSWDGVVETTWDGGAVETAWDGPVEIHTIESLHAKYDQTNLFDPSDWEHVHRPRWPRNTPKWTSRSADLDIILANMEVGDAWSCDNCTIQRIK